MYERELTDAELDYLNLCVIFKKDDIDKMTLEQRKTLLSLMGDGLIEETLEYFYSIVGRDNDA